MKALIVEDLHFVRTGLRRIIELRWPTARVTEAESLSEALQQVHQEAPDFVLLDSTLPDAQAGEGLDQLLRLIGSVPVLVLSLSKDISFAHQLLSRGAAGHLGKDATGEELIRAIERVMTGKRYVSPEMAEQLVEQLAQGRAISSQPHERLTAQEFRVMVLISEGHKTGEIADLMRLSAKTISNYRTSILEKTGWKSDAELIKYCLFNDLTSLGR